MAATSLDLPEAVSVDGLEVSYDGVEADPEGPERTPDSASIYQKEAKPTHKGV